MFSKIKSGFFETTSMLLPATLTKREFSYASCSVGMNEQLHLVNMKNRPAAMRANDTMAAIKIFLPITIPLRLSSFPTYKTLSSFPSKGRGESVNS
jgi:hypothetical protein